MLNQLSNFLLNGYAHFNESDLLDLSKFNIVNVEITDNLDISFSEEEQLLIDKYVEYVSKKYVEPIYKNYIVTYCAVWDGVDLGSTEWHNDKIEGFDFSVLYYYDSTNEESGGQIEFKFPDGETIIYPKSGDLIFINQDKKFFHKASRSNSSRRVASIEYKIYE